MDGGGDVGDFDIGDLWSDGEGDEVGPRPTREHRALGNGADAAEQTLCGAAPPHAL